jgi:hypothetical protein
LEDLGNGQTEWRGPVQHVPSGETRYFRDWVTLVEVMTAMLPGMEGNEVPTRID